MELRANDIHKINIISDTHFKLSKNAYKALKGDFNQDKIYDELCLSDKEFDFHSLDSKTPDLIIHAGDIGSQEIVDKLEGIAPLVAVNGNCDFQDFKTLRGWTQDLELFDFDNTSIVVTHRPYMVEPYLDEISLCIHGHTHESRLVQLDNGGLLVCPGSASLGRYGTPNSIASVYIANSKPVFAELIKVK